MTIDIITLQLILGIILFFIINWIGAHSYSVGYMEISMFLKIEEAPALNFLIRVLSPIVYLLIISALFYSFNMDRFVNKIYFVNIYYLTFRLLFNLFTGRGALLNWYKQLFYWLSVIFISYFLYIKIIKLKSNLLPDFKSLANELWIIIIVFLFQLFNKINFSQDQTKKRKD